MCQRIWPEQPNLKGMGKSSSWCRQAGRNEWPGGSPGGWHSLRACARAGAVQAWLATPHPVAVAKAGRRWDGYWANSKRMGGGETLHQMVSHGQGRTAAAGHYQALQKRGGREGGGSNNKHYEALTEGTEAEGKTARGVIKLTPAAQACTQALQAEKEAIIYTSGRERAIYTHSGLGKTFGLGVSFSLCPAVCSWGDSCGVVGIE